MKLLILLSLMFAGSQSFAAAAEKPCALCLKAVELAQKIESSKVMPDPLNPKTVDQQQKFVDDAAPLVQQLMVQAVFTEAHAEALVCLIKAVRPYDQQIMIPELATGPFSKLYDSPKRILANALDGKNLKACSFSAADKKAMLDYLGIAPK